MKLFYTPIIISLLFFLFSQQQLFAQEINDAQSLRIVDASYPFDNHTIPKNLHLIIEDDLMTRVRSNSATNQDLAVTLELLVTRCDVRLIRDTIIVNNLRPLRDTTVLFQFPEPLFLFKMVPPHCESYAFGGIPYGEIKYELSYEVFKIEPDGNWISQEKLIHSFGHFPKTLSKEDPTVNDYESWKNPIISFYDTEYSFNTVFKIDSIKHGDVNPRDFLAGINFYDIEIGLINSSEEVVSNDLFVIIYEYLGDGEDFDQDKFTNLNHNGIHNHPMLEMIAISIQEQTLLPNSSKLFLAYDWYDSEFNPVYPFELGCFLLEYKTFVVSVNIINQSESDNNLKVAYNQGVPTNNKIHSFFYSEVNGLKFNDDLPHHPVIRLLTFLKSGLCSQKTTGTNEVQNFSNLEIYPNPATDFIYLSITEKIDLNSYSIFSLDGKKVQSGNLDQGTNNLSINVGSLKSGFYFLEFRTQDSLIRKPLIIKSY